MRLISEGDIFMNYTYEDELKHFGVRGMKWGVRRYQNYDGSYTQAGLKRYRSSLDSYERAKEKHRDAKAKYKSGKASKYDVQYSKARVKETKKRLKKDYKHLKEDKLADEGKILYKKGVRITSNAKITSAIAKAAAYASIGSEVAHRYGYIDAKTARTVQVASIGATAVSGIKGLIDEIPNRKLRAYYSHTSNY